MSSVSIRPGASGVLDACRVRRLRDQVGDRAMQLPRLVRRVRLENPRLRLHHSPSAENVLPRRREVSAQSARARARHPAPGRALRQAGSCRSPAPLRASRVRLAFAQPRRSVSAAAPCSCPRPISAAAPGARRPPERGRERPATPRSARLALRDDSVGVGVLDRPLAGPEGGLVDQNAARRRAAAAAPPCRQRRPMRPPRPASGRASSAISASPVVMPIRLHVAVLGQRLHDRQGRADRPLRIVLVGGRHPEQGHDRVADELLHRAAVALELRAQPGVQRAG